MTEYRPRVGAWLLALVGLGSPAADSSSGSGNVLITHDAIFVAQNGVRRYDLKAGTRTWETLAERRISGLALTGRDVLAAGVDGIYALASDTGLPRWRVPTQTRAFTPITYRGVVYAGTQDGALLAMDPRSGHRIWERRFAGWVYPPATAGGLLIVGGSSAWLSGVDPVSGALRWRRPVDQELVYRPVQTAANRVAITTFAGTVTVLSAAGVTIWSVRDTTPSLSPTPVDGRLYLAGLDGVLRVRDADDGHLIWRRKVADRFIVPPAVSAHTAVVVHGKRVTAMDRDTGRRIATHVLPFFPATTPAVADGRFILLSADGRPYVFDPRDTAGVIQLSATDEGVMP